MIGPICFLVFGKKVAAIGLRPIRKRTELYDLQAESVAIVIVLVVTAVT